MKQVKFFVVSQKEFFRKATAKKVLKTYLFIGEPVSYYGEFLKIQRALSYLVEISRAQKYRLIPALIIKPMGLEKNRALLRKRVRKWLK